MLLGLNSTEEQLSGLNCRDVYHHKITHGHNYYLEDQPRSARTLALLGACVLLVAWSWCFFLRRTCGALERQTLGRFGVRVPSGVRVALFAAAAGLKGRFVLNSFVYACLGTARALRVSVRETMPLYWIAELLGPDSSSLPNFNVIAAADFDGRRIAEYTEGFRRGLIVKGLAAGTPANAKWSFKWLRQQTAGKGVQALVKLDRDAQGQDTGEYAHYEEIVDMFAQSKAEGTPASLFSISDWNLFLWFPELLDTDVALYTLVPELFGKPLKEATIAHQFNVHRAPSKPDDICDGRGFGWHTAPSWTLATLPRGTKKWTFVTRENLMYLRPFAAPTGVMFSWWGHEPKLDEKDAGLYAQIPTQSYVQEAGDVIYFPAWMPHKTEQVHSPEVDNEVILVSFRGLDPWSCFNDPGHAWSYLVSQLQARDLLFFWDYWSTQLGLQDLGKVRERRAGFT